MGYRPGTMDDLDYRQRLIARTARQAVEAARATGTQSYGTTAKVKHQKIDIVHALDESAQAQDAAAGAAKDAAGAADTAARARDVAAGAADNAARAQDMASAAADEAAAAASQAAAAVRTAGEAQAAAGAASVAADRAGRVAHRVDGSRVVAADAQGTPAIGPEPVTLVQVRVPEAAGYGRVRVSLAAFGSLLSSGPAVLQVRLRVGGRVTAWMAAAYAGDGVPYPGDVAPMRSFSLAGYEENVGQDAVLAVEAVCPWGAWPAGTSGMAHLSARIDYMEVA